MRTKPLLKYVKRRYFLLVEVLIAFAIVVAALLPLLHPHFYIYKQQSQFIDKINLDMAVNNLYSRILQQLQSNEISWDFIESGREMPINDQMWNLVVDPGTRIPFKGAYQFQIVHSKKNKEYGLYFLNLIFILVPHRTYKNEDEQMEKALKFNFNVFASRLFKKD